jgi:hypothetical protein
MEEYKLRLLYAGLALAAFVLVVGVVASVLNLTYASQIIVAALTAIGFLVRAIVRNLEPEDRKRPPQNISALSKNRESDSPSRRNENRSRRKLHGKGGSSTLTEDTTEQFGADSDVIRRSQTRTSNSGMGD